MHRRDLLLTGLASLAGCHRRRAGVDASPPLDLRRLDTHFPDLANSARPGVFNAAVMNLEAGDTWYWNAAKVMPLGPCVALPVLATMFNQIDAGDVPDPETIAVADMDLSPPPSAVGDAWPATTAYALEPLMQGAIDGDNTAIDLLMRQAKGPGAVSAFLQGKGVTTMTVRRYQREAVVEALGMSPFRPAWRGGQAFAAALATVPQAQRQAAMTAFLSTPPNGATTQAALNLLDRLNEGSLLSDNSSRSLRALMAAARPSTVRLEDGLPRGATLYQVPGQQAGADDVVLADNALAICRLGDGRAYAIAGFLSGSSAAEPLRRRLYGDFMHLCVESFR